jgi:hypothetical protein
VLSQHGITHIASYSPQGRGRMGRVLGTLQKRLPRELRLARIKTNRFLRERFVPGYNARFAVGLRALCRPADRRHTVAQEDRSSVPTIAFPTTGAACRFRRSAIAGTMCGPSCGCMDIRMAGLPSWMVRVVWRGSSQKEAIARPNKPLNSAWAVRPPCGFVDRPRKRPAYKLHKVIKSKEADI